MLSLKATSRAIRWHYAILVRLLEGNVRRLLRHGGNKFLRESLPNVFGMRRFLAACDLPALLLCTGDEAVRAPDTSVAW